MAQQIPLQRMLTLGARGPDVLAVRRALGEAGFTRFPKRPFSRTDRFYGPGMVRAVTRFQRVHALAVDGKYGKETHGKLVELECFDSFGRRLMHLTPPPKQRRGIQLPRSQAPTHETGGLDGFPARDYLEKPGTRCFAPEDGQLTRHTGHDPSLGGPPGGPLGYSFYFVGQSGKTYYGTHLSRIMPLGRYRRGEPVCTIANGPPSWSVPHIHWGIHDGRAEVAFQPSTSHPPRLQ